MGGARLGRHRAADRLAARRRDPAPDRLPLGATAGMGGAVAARRPRRRADRGPRAGRARRDGPGAEARPGAASRSRARPRRAAATSRRPRPIVACSRSRTSAPGRFSAWACSAAATPTPARRRPRLRQARRRAQRPRPPRDGRGGRGVLRALRAVPRPRRHLRARRPPLAGRAGTAAAARAPDGRRRPRAPGVYSSARPGSSSLVSSSSACGGTPIRPSSVMKSANCCHWPRSM